MGAETESWPAGEVFHVHTNESGSLSCLLENRIAQSKKYLQNSCYSAIMNIPECLGENGYAEGTWNC